MANTTASFDAVLKRYMPYELLVEELKAYNYFWNKVQKKQGWKGGTLEIPFESGAASSLSMGALTSATDIAEHTEVMGTISTQPELWGTMKFNEKDLDRHSGDLEASYLAIAPGKQKQFIKRMSDRVSIMLLGDGSITAATSDGLVGGTIVVADPEKFDIGEKVVVDDDNSAAVSGYVTAIDINTKTLTIKDARSAGAAVDLSGYTVAQNAKIYLPGVQASGFTSLKTQLLSLANGGSTNLFGVAKTTSPFLQALNWDGSTFDASNILEGVFSYFYDTMKFGKGNPTEVVCSLKNFKNMALSQEAKKQYVVADKKVGFGYAQMTLVGNTGELTVTGVRDMADSDMYVMDWDALKFHGDKFFERKRHMDGSEAFLVRNTTGYEYLIDVKFYGDLVVHNPSHCGIIHSISY
jgi:hypothetical protein